MGAALSSPSFQAVLPSEAPSARRLVVSSKPQKYTREELKLMRTLLPSFVFLEKSSEAHRHIAGAHWDRVFQVATASTTSHSSLRESKSPTMNHGQQKSKVLELYDEFFGYVEMHAPELRPVFRSSMHIRGKVLVHISIGMRTLMASENFVEKVLPLTKTHRRFGVKLEHYEPLGRALMHAMQVVSGKDEWTPEVEDAWKRLFSHTSVILMRAQKRVDAAVAKEAAKPITPRQNRHSYHEPKAKKKSAVVPTVADLVPHVLFGRRGFSVHESMQGPTNRFSVGGYDTEAASRHVAAGPSSIAEH